MQVAASSGKESEGVAATGLVSDSADSMDVSRRQSVRYATMLPVCSVYGLAGCNALLKCIVFGNDGYLLMQL